MHNTSQESDFARMVNRRSFLKKSAAGLGAMVAAIRFPTQPALAENSVLDFDQVAANDLDTVTLPPGYQWHVVTSWGDPMYTDSSPFNHKTRGTAATQRLAFGDNNDGMVLFEVDKTYLLAVNNEYCNLEIMFPGGTPVTRDDLLKTMAAHGCSLVELVHSNRRWTVKVDSGYNRRITPETPMEITGPARGHRLLRTSEDPYGTVAIGTWSNCGSGRTPWGTYLTCEENFNGYFSSSDSDYRPDAALKRYGIGTSDRGYGWAHIDQRFDISRHPNEPNRFGYIVEIDPMAPDSTPRKHSALGRLKHENVAMAVAANGALVAYMGDDERGEYLYRFISSGTWQPGTNGSHLLEDGTLYVARFDSHNTGRWIPLTRATTGMSKAQIAIHTRTAASRAKGTTMDRPEWVAVDPDGSAVYCCLTNNRYRGIEPNAGGDFTPVDGPNNRKANIYGQIVRWYPEGGDHTADTLTWDLYVTAGNPHVFSGPMAGSSNINAANMFNSPDGIAFSPAGNKLWILTDGTYSNKGAFARMGNNQMLAGDPASGEIRRFMVGPRQAEVTGITWTSDRRTLFVGLQHPGEKGGDSHFPDGGNTLPRSSVIAIERTDHGAFV